LGLSGVTTICAVSAAATVPHPPAAKLTLAQARAIALKKAPGTAVEGEYEEENGAWRYSFDIRQGKRIHEIGVDPNTGKIVEDSYESPGKPD
jgi:uncharacterized membrane protein YkoI